MKNRLSVLLESVENMKEGDTVDFNKVKEVLDHKQMTKDSKINWLQRFKEKIRDNFVQRKKFKEMISQAEPEIKQALIPTINKLTEGEVTMDKKKTNLDMFLEGVESVEVSKKPKFHSIHRLYEARDEDLEDDEVQENKECDKDDEKDEMDEKIFDASEVAEDEDEEKSHEDKESDDEEAAEKEAGDEDEEGGKDEEPETDDDEGEEKDQGEKDEGEGEDMEEGAAEDILRALGSDPISGIADLVTMASSKINEIVAKYKDEAQRKAEIKKVLQQKAMEQKARLGGKKSGLPKAPPSSVTNLKGAPADFEENEMDEGAQGYAAGLKGVRKDAGAKHLKSGTNKVPTPKVEITGDKKLLKKPTTLKGDTYPKSTVAGAARPGAPKIKKS